MAEIDITENVPIYSVTEISHAVKSTVEDAFSYVRVRGEISGFKQAASGHMYMSLKDDKAVLDAVCWRGTSGRLQVKPEDGLEVIATGRITTYPGRSKYQIVIESLELAGEGALLKLLEERRKKLAAEGLFDEERKQPIPFLPTVIGVVTSPTGAVFRDIMHRLRERFPRHVLLWPVLVQGEGGAEQVAAAVDGFNRLEEGGKVPRPDVLIVGRGGGSLEDLWAFNEEVVVRAIAASQIPVISAVGHETDTTLADFAADRRAPTPTAAAEMAVPVRAELLANVKNIEGRLMSSVSRRITEQRRYVEGLARGLPNLRRLVEEMAQRLDDRSERLGNGINIWVERKRARLNELSAKITAPTALIREKRGTLDREGRTLGAAFARFVRDCEKALARVSELLESYSFERVLERGFVLVSDPDGHPVTSASKLAVGDEAGLRFHDGERRVQVTDDKGGNKPVKKSAKTASRKTASTQTTPEEKPKGKNQGDLFS